MSETATRRPSGVPWPIWLILGLILLALAVLAGLRLTEEPAVAAAPVRASATPVAQVAPDIVPEPARPLVHLAALNEARSNGTALVDEVSRLRWALLDQRRECVVEEPPPAPPRIAAAEPPPRPPVEPVPPAAGEPVPEPQPVVVAEVEVREAPVVRVPATITPAPPPPSLTPVRERAPDPPPPPPVQVAEAPSPVAPPVPQPPQVASAPQPAAQPAPPPGCPPLRPPEEAPEVVFVLDASESMLIPYGAQPGVDDRIMSMQRQGPLAALQAQQMFQQLLGQGGARRIDRAKEALIGVIRSTPPDVDMGLVTFRDCGSITNHGYFDSRARGALASRVQGTQTGRGTPLADSMAAAGNLLRGGRSSADPAYMVVVTDGNDSCGGNPCAVAQRLASLYPGLVINVIDLSGTANLQCVAGATGGRLVRPEGSGGLTQMMQRMTGQQSVPAHCIR